MAALTAGMGEEWVMNYARKIKEQQPVFVRGNTRALTAIVAGEYVMHQMTNYHSCVRASKKDVTKSLVCHLVEPIPARIQEVEQVVKTAPHPYAAVLFLEHEASTEGQKVVDEFEPLKSHVYADGEIAKLARGRKVSLNDFKTYHSTPKWMKMVLETYGFPKAEKLK
jgi:ABC-type Fe3+ transport system substrate-binding protein